MTMSASRPRAANDTCGWSLRRTSGQLRNTSGTTPTPRVGGRDGSNAGISSWIVSTHASGTGGFRQPIGSERSLL